MSELAAEIQAEIRRHADPEKAAATERFFREPVRSLGLTAPQCKEIAKAFYPRVKGDLPLALEVTGRLLESGVLTDGAVGLYMLRRLSKQITPGHFDVFDRWVDLLTNWGTTDHLCTGIIVEAIRKDPGLVERLLEWTGSENRWRRRASAVSLVPIARRGEMLEEVFRVADRLMTDGDDMVQKGAGWLLKEASREHPDEVREYLLRWREEAPALILRYASEKLPKDKRVLKTR